MRRKLEVAKISRKNKVKEMREQNKLLVAPGSNYNVVDMDKHQGHVSTNDQDQINVQEIDNEPIDQIRNHYNTEHNNTNTIILVSNTQIETEPNISRGADQTVDFNRDDFGDGGDEMRRSRSI